MDSWKQDPCIANQDNIPDLVDYLQISVLEWVQYFCDPLSADKNFKTWKPKEWWQACAPEDNIEEFYEELCNRNIPWEDGRKILDGVIPI